MDDLNVILPIQFHAQVHALRDPERRLGFDADYVRIGLCRWREAERARCAEDRPVTPFRGARPQRASHAQRRAA